jgi:beta-1,2-mannobiose phosphorylase / 1,2-beta-oligomannan phosphorylase
MYRDIDLDRESIWISCCQAPVPGQQVDRFGRFTSHHRLATPVSPWERLKIGSGTPPVLTMHGWLIVCHGVSQSEDSTNEGHQLCY